MANSPRAKYSLEGVSRQLIKTIHSLAEQLADNPTIKKDTVAFIEQLNILIDRVLILQGKPTTIKKDIKETVQGNPSPEASYKDVNDILDTFKEADNE